MSTILVGRNRQEWTVVGVDSGDRDDIDTHDETWWLTDVAIFDDYGKLLDTHDRYGMRGANLVEAEGDSIDLANYLEVIGGRLDRAHDEYQAAARNLQAAKATMSKIQKAQAKFTESAQ